MEYGKHLLKKIQNLKTPIVKGHGGNLELLHKRDIVDYEKSILNCI